MWYIILLFLYFNNLINGEEIVVNTESGKIKGNIIVFHNKTLNVFNGIRYGKPPIGNLRFKRPQKVEKWKGIYDATTMKNACWQNKLFFPFGYKTMDEDCLFLNIWAPNNDNSKQLKSVMVWIHDDGFQIGSIWDQFYNATPLATFDVVVVSISYRLGPFGFLYGQNDEAPGNVGLYDQLLALKWVNQFYFINSTILF